MREGRKRRDFWEISLLVKFDRQFETKDKITELIDLFLLKYEVKI